ncbi:MAG TPA: peptidylprolyl isomerase [Bryobacteraceae bacterium]|jgi:parvulin-like peptidyl-prolyl isomerase|nr:peptidylprolyl isomerase [Bryobacteraceae bacterium]
MSFGRVLAVCVSGASLLCAADATLVEEIIAKVNGDIITRGDIERQRKQIEAEARQQGLVGARLQEAIEGRSKNILRDRIDQLLLVQKGKELNINVDAEVSKFIARLQAESKIADPEKFQAYVREQTGMPFEDYRNEIKNNMLTERVIREEVARRVNIKPEELKKYYEEHKSEFVREERVFLAEILISTEGKDAAGIAAAEKKAKDISARAAKGEKFAELAQNNSDAQTARNGGDIGGFEKGKLRPDIEAAVWNQPRGFVTPPIKVDSGFLILKVQDHQKAGQATFEEVQNEIMDKLFGPRMDPALREYLTKLRQEAFLEIKPGYIDSGAAPGKDTTWTDPAQLKPETVTKEEVSAKTRRKKLLWVVPIPGTKSGGKAQSSSR